MTSLTRDPRLRIVLAVMVLTFSETHIQIFTDKIIRSRFTLTEYPRTPGNHPEEIPLGDYGQVVKKKA